MLKNKPIKKESRQGPDIITRIIDLLSISLWIFTFFNIALILFAKPIGETFFDRLFNITVRGYWDVNILTFVLILSFVQFFISLFSLFLNTKRLKRKGDRIRVSIVISIFASLLMCLTLFFVVLF